MTVQFLYGQEDFLIEQVIKKLRKSLDKNFASMNFKKYDNPNFADLISIIRTQPMMFGKMLIVINCEKYFAKSFDDREITQIKDALDDNSENVDIVLVAQMNRDERASKPDQRKKITKLFMKYNAQEFKTLYPNEVEQFIIKECHND